jgi:hypothetical protein
MGSALSVTGMLSAQHLLTICRQGLCKVDLISLLHGWVCGGPLLDRTAKEGL